MKTTRRSFLKWLGLAPAAAVVAKEVITTLPAVEAAPIAAPAAAIVIRTIAVPRSSFYQYGCTMVWFGSGNEKFPTYYWSQVVDLDKENT